MSPTLIYSTQKHNVLVVGPAVWDLFISPQTKKEYKLFDSFHRLPREEQINKAIAYAEKERIPFQKIPGGQALNFAQYLAAMKAEGEEDL